MARILLQGEKHTIELQYGEEGGVFAKCIGTQYAAPDPLEVVYSPCEDHWLAFYRSMDDAMNYAGDHADQLR